MCNYVSGVYPAQGVAEGAGAPPSRLTITTMLFSKDQSHVIKAYFPQPAGYSLSDAPLLHWQHRASPDQSHVIRARLPQPAGYNLSDAPPISLATQGLARPVPCD